MTVGSVVIACDIDEVLFPYLSGYVRYYNRIHGSNTKVSDFHSYDFTKVHTHLTKDDVAEIVYSYHDEPEFHEIEPLTGALEAVRELQQLGELHIVTARQTAIANKTYDWINKHFQIEKERIHIGNHVSKSTDLYTMQRSKEEMCRAINAKILIDDSLDYATECAKAGMMVILFDLEGCYGWNKIQGAEELHSNITRVHSWEEAVEVVRKAISHINDV